MLSAAITPPAADRFGGSSDSPVMNRASQVTQDVRRYMSIMTGVNSQAGEGDAFFLIILGADYVILWGLLAWFMGYTPSIGF